MALYSDGIIALKRQNVSDVVVELQRDEQREIVAEIEELDPTSPDFLEEIDNLTIEGKAGLLEETAIMSINGDQSDFVRVVMDKFENMFFEFNEPVTEINRLIDIDLNRGTRPGRKPDPKTKKRTKKIKVDDETLGNIQLDTETEVVYLHSVYTFKPELTAYAKIAKFNKAEGRVRLYKPSENLGWRDLTPYENTVYNALIQWKIEEFKRPFEQQDIYGQLFADGRFSIRNKLTEKPGAATDARKHNRGKVCKTWDKNDLYDVAWHVELPIIPTYQITDDRNQLIANLVSCKINKSREEMNQWPTERLQYYQYWCRSGIKRPALCNMLQQHMDETGRLMRIVK